MIYPFRNLLSGSLGLCRAADAAPASLIAPHPCRVSLPPFRGRGRGRHSRPPSPARSTRLSSLGLFARGVSTSEAGGRAILHQLVLARMG